VTGRFAPDSDEALKRLAGAREALSILDKRFEDEPFLAAGRYTIADIAVYAYSHLAGDVGSTSRRIGPSAAGWTASEPSRASSTTSSPIRRTRPY
jgi:glutathione S-transferase